MRKSRQQAAMAAFPSTTTVIPLLFILVLSSLVIPAASQSNDTDLDIYRDSEKYIYQGCFNETLEIPNSTHARALDGGTMQILEGEMTVPLCLSFCNNGGGPSNAKEFKYAGLQYSRECWCAQYLSGLSAKVPDDQCDHPCDGAPETACGGAMKLTLYMVDESASADMTLRAWSWSMLAILGTATSYVVM